nr:MAG TPA: hypothetical protein [Herelleviridae sp.]
MTGNQRAKPLMIFRAPVRARCLFCYINKN